MLLWVPRQALLLPPSGVLQVTVSLSRRILLAQREFSKCHLRIFRIIRRFRFSLMPPVLEAAGITFLKPMAGLAAASS